MTKPEQNHYLDYRSDIAINASGRLPHWHQQDKYQAITIRLADSLPLSVRAALEHERENWAHNHPEPWDEATKKEHDRLFRGRIQQLLDNGYGKCVLRNREAAEKFAEILYRDNDVRYDVTAYVVMPNHVHLVILPMSGSMTSEIIGQLKGCTSYEINKILKTSGPLWQKEYFDRIIRNEDHFNHALRYIIDNYNSGGILIGGRYIEGGFRPDR